MKSKNNNFSERGIVRLTGNEKAILKMLLQDSRTPDANIGQKLRISSQAVSKIKRKLKQLDIIRNYVTDLDYSKLGINTFALVLLEISPFDFEKNQEDKFMLKNSIGFYKVFKNDITHIALFAFRNLEELDKYFDFLHSKYSGYIKIKNVYTFPVQSLLKHSFNNLFSLLVKEFGKEKFPVPSSLNYHLEEKKKNGTEELSSNEKNVLKSLIKDSRMSCQRIASELNNGNLTISGINKIKKRLEDRKIIRNYSIDLNYEKLGANVLSFLFINKKRDCWDLKDGLYKWAIESPNVIGCYKLNENSSSVLFCAFRSLKELENYFNHLQSQNENLLELEKVYIISPNGIIQDTSFDLFNTVLK